MSSPLSSSMSLGRSTSVRLPRGVGSGPGGAMGSRGEPNGGDHRRPSTATAALPPGSAAGPGSGAASASSSSPRQSSVTRVMNVPIIDQKHFSGRVPDDVYRVLLTGYGPFHRYKENNSWLSVAPLNNQLLTLDVPDPADRMDEDVPSPEPVSGPSHHNNGHTPANLAGAAAQASPSASPVAYPPRYIHISALLLPVTYQGVHDLVPGLHQRPPVLPVPPASVMDAGSAEEEASGLARPPDAGYDFVFHLGLAGRGGLRMERLGHKIGYRMKDSVGEQAPIVDYLPDAAAADALEQSQAAMLAEARTTLFAESRALDLAGEGPVESAVQEPVRGFGKGFEGFPDDFHTGIDVERLVHDLKAMGIQDVYTSMDAGHYVCDYTYYCSLAEARRSAQKYDKGRHTKVLFMHVPPAGQPLETEEITEAVKKIIAWVSQIQDG